MARGTYISENLTQPQIEMMLLLDEYEMDIFTLQELQELSAHQFDNFNELVENLSHKKILSRIERGKYCRSNFRDEKVIGTRLVEYGALAYWSALNLHGLIKQFPNSVFIQTTKVKPPKQVFGLTYKFVKITPKKKTGIIKEGHGNHSYAISDIEKTIVDYFDLPQHTGGFADLIRAFDTAKVSEDKMMEYCKAVNNLAATNRIGYLSEMLDKKGMKSFIRFAKDQLTQTYNPLGPLGVETGKYNAEWKLKLNISEAEVLKIVSQNCY
ncbi:type IV toxin-antitoxin system AbiEi family antitoxin domain-containing protein [Algoriphagus algorifonticola]|uniref:type IV toxin-antitoxin system AbiEi family antitoxin domain-containing protein n=1 Tax=Algoriphagus algorifonticola TaxID=2593007 RepID=UPI002022BE22|nr:hypothetical protein [Algoriphagus algorifonticola]